MYFAKHSLLDRGDDCVQMLSGHAVGYLTVLVTYQLEDAFYLHLKNISVE